MFSKILIKSYQRLYSWLILFYPRDFYQRFASELESTFEELLAEKLNQKVNLFSFVLWVYFETFTNIFLENLKFYLMKPIIFIRTALISAAILLIPLIAMQFNQEMDWSTFDFVFMGTLLFLAGTSIEFFIARTSNIYYRLGAMLTVFTTIFLIVSNGSVGLVGSENESFNLWYYGIVLLIIAGSLISNFQSKAMSYTLFVASGVQGLLALTALSLNLQQLPGSSVNEILLVNSFFMSLFITSGFLFYKSKDVLDSSKSKFVREGLA